MPLKTNKDKFTFIKKFLKFMHSFSLVIFQESFEELSETGSSFSNALELEGVGHVLEVGSRAASAVRLKKTTVTQDLCVD